jgi:hypothetical protein
MVAKYLRAWAAPLATAAMTATLALADVQPAAAQRTMDEAVFGRPGFTPMHERKGHRNTYKQAAYADEPEEIVDEAPKARSSAPKVVREPEPVYESEGEGDVIYDDGGSSCDNCAPECVRRLFWLRGEYLYWWTKGYDVPPLVTTSGATGTGALGAAGTNVVYGGDLMGNDGRSGAKLTLGWELFTETPAGVELSYFGLGKEENNFRLDTPSGITVARPFFNINPDTGIARQDAELVSQPGVLSGAVSVDSTTELQGGEAILRWTTCEACERHTDMLIGYRFLRLDDSMIMREDLRTISTAGGVVAGTTFNLFDEFDTENEFHGVEIGTSSSFHRGRWTMDTTVKLGIGSTRTTTTIGGQTVRTVPNAGSATSAGGLLSQPSNIGTREFDSFTMVPELGVMLKYDITCNVQATVGYSFLYWSKVGRAAEQIDTDVNLTQQPPGPVTGDLRPRALEVSNDFWAQGLSAGLEWTF